jgi:hypothetical protein
MWGVVVVERNFDHLKNVTLDGLCYTIMSRVVIVEWNLTICREQGKT